MSETNSISKEELETYPIEEFLGEIVEVHSDEEAEKAVKHLTSAKLVGFDTETRPSYKKGVVRGVALMQLSTEDTCYLFRLNTLGFPPALVMFLANAKVKKVGLSIHDDFLSINRRESLVLKGFVDLQKIIPLHGYTDLGLQKIYALLFKKKIAKGQRLTNWEATSLTVAQKKYAALDAWACLQLYKALQSEI